MVLRYSDDNWSTINLKSQAAVLQMRACTYTSLPMCYRELHTPLQCNAYVFVYSPGEASWAMTLGLNVVANATTAIAITSNR